MFMRTSVGFLVTGLIVISLGFVGVGPEHKANAQDGAANTQTAPEYEKDDNVEIFRKAKEGRRPPARKSPPKRPVIIPRLSMQYWMMIRNRDCQAQEVDPNANFLTDDQLRIGAKVNQPGYLYILLTLPDRDEATMVFPDPRINRGSNRVTKNLEIIVPYRCPTTGEPDDKCPRVNPATDCWWNMVKPYGEKEITVIFSRDEIIELDNLYKRSVRDPQGSRDLPKLSLDALDRIKSQTVQREDLKRERVRPNPNKLGYIAANFVTRITNLNRRDNEEIVETVTLNHINSNRD
jgi:Domain of unknown function (DUF4384)